MPEIYSEKTLISGSSSCTAADTQLEGSEVVSPYTSDSMYNCYSGIIYIGNQTFNFLPEPCYGKHTEHDVSSASLRPANLYLPNLTNLILIDWPRRHQKLDEKVE